MEIFGGGGTCSQEEALGAVPEGTPVQLSSPLQLKQSFMEPGSSGGKAQSGAPVLVGVSTAPRRANGLEDTRSGFSSAALLSSVSN